MANPVAEAYLSGLKLAPVPRNRIVYALLVALVIALGLASRQNWVPALVYPYLGDALYALMLYFGFAFLAPKLSMVRLFWLSLITCFAIEALQLYQAPWLNQIRSNRFGALVLGSGFLYSDLLCYFFGALSGYMTEHFILKQKVNSLDASV